MITNSPSYSKSVTLNGLRKIKNVIVITEIIGSFDILAIAFVTDLNSIIKLVSAVKGLDSVERVEVSLVEETDMPVTPNFGKVYSKRSYELATT